MALAVCGREKGWKRERWRIDGRMAGGQKATRTRNSMRAQQSPYERTLKHARPCSESARNKKAALLNGKPPYNEKARTKTGFEFVVVGGGLEPSARGFSIRCSTN